jgi:FKBP12-rapamycin complex-associated protein
MELAVPGTYIAGEPLVTIAAFAPQLHVISSKQRPRKLTIHGGDGAEYMFLLKVSGGGREHEQGHEGTIRMVHNVKSPDKPRFRRST